jgi:DNA-binding transcriptional regulator YhcF (GntR family)
MSHETQQRVQSINGDEVRSQLVRRILSGEWQAGARIPSCRKIASEIGSNANTVNRELQRLGAEGLVRTEPRRGTYVTGSGISGILRSDLEDKVEELTRQAIGTGLTRDDLIALIDRAFDVTRTTSVAFAECNSTDLNEMSNLIANSTGVRVSPVLIEDLAERDRSTPFDLILSPLFHLAEVRNAVDDGDRILELNFTASTKTLRKLALLDTDRAVTVAASTIGGAERLAAVIRTVFPGRITQIAQTGEWVSELESVDVLVYVNALMLTATDLSQPQQAICIDWQLDGNSVEQLRSRVLHLNSNPPSGSEPKPEPIDLDIDMDMDMDMDMVDY